MTDASPIELRILECDLRLRDAHARLPFRFGINTMTAAPLCLLAVTCETNAGQRVTGFASDLLVPKWFEKNPSTPISDDWRDLIESARSAASAALEDQSHATPFAHWRRLYESNVASLPAAAPNTLVINHGVSLIERALIDCACRAAGRSFSDALSEDILGFRPSELDRDASAWSPRDLAPPLAEITLRHTVGLLDPLTRSDVSDAPDDGLPVTLADDIDAYKLTHFKLKVAGDESQIRDRLSRIARVVRGRAGDQARFTLDGNEQCESLAALAGALDDARSDDNIDWILRRVMWIEQPLSRTRSFATDALAGMDALEQIAPVIIDEADDRIDAFVRARDAGYRGISVKNCKGVFRALLNAARCHAWGDRYFQTAEDLTNLPAVALQQDLATMATLSLKSVERNGHHYFRGLTHLPQSDIDAALSRHPDLYDHTSRALRIQSGSISTASVIAARGFGYDGPIELDQWTPANAWSPDRLIAQQRNA